MTAPASMPPNERRPWIATTVAAVTLVALTAASTVVVEHRIHAGEHEAHEDHEGEEDHHGQEAPRRLKLSEDQLEAAGVELQEASAGKVVVSLQLPGEVALNEETLAHVGPRVPGTVRKIEHRLGDRVEAGDVLAVLDSADVAEMQGVVMVARERLALARAEHERKRKLYEEEIGSQKDYLVAKQAYAEAKVELKSSMRALGAKTGGRSASGGYLLVAPIDGTIVDWHLGVGEVLASDTKAFTIADLSTVWGLVTVYAKDLSRVRVGQRVVVRGEGIEEPQEARIDYLSHTVGRLTRSATARIVLEDPGEAWRPGLFVTAEVEVDEIAAQVVIPEAAVQRHDGQAVVFEREGDEFIVRPVTLGSHGHVDDARVVEVVDGLEPGATVAAENSFLIKAELEKSSAGHQH